MAAVQAGGNSNDTLTGADGTDLRPGQNGDTRKGDKGGNDAVCGADRDRFDGGAGTDTVSAFNATDGARKPNLP